MHDYEPGCSCDYCQVMDSIISQYRREAKTDAFRRAYSGEDPFKPSQTGRFKVNHPPYEQKRKHTHPGRYQRFYNNAFDWFEWQYKPWPSAEWVTYYKVSNEMMTREVNRIGVKLASRKFHTAASQALSEERFHKIERIDAPA